MEAIINSSDRYKMLSVSFFILRHLRVTTGKVRGSEPLMEGIKVHINFIFKIIYPECPWQNVSMITENLENNLDSVLITLFFEYWIEVVFVETFCCWNVLSRSGFAKRRCWHGYTCLPSFAISSLLSSEWIEWKPSNIGFKETRNQLWWCFDVTD